MILPRRLQVPQMQEQGIPGNNEVLKWERPCDKEGTKAKCSPKHQVDQTLKETIGESIHHRMEEGMPEDNGTEKEGVINIVSTAPDYAKAKCSL